MSTSSGSVQVGVAALPLAVTTKAGGLFFSITTLTSVTSEIGSFASAANASMVAKADTTRVVNPILSIGVSLQHRQLVRA